MKKRPERFNFSMILDAIEQTLPQSEHFSFNEDFGMLNGGDSRLFSYMLSKDTPLLIDDYRFGLLLEGDVRSNINLMERHVTGGTLVFIGPGTIIQPVSISPHVRLKGIALFRSLPVEAGRRLALFNGTVRDFLLPLTPEQQRLVEAIIDAMWLTAHTEPFSRETFDALTLSLMQHYDHLYRLHEAQQVRPTHATEVFRRFIQLVNRHARREHQLAFYADRLCLTQRHLGTLVRQVSGLTAKEWIDRALVTEARVMLKHTEKPVAEIADELCFPNPSFFSKYFRRLTGQTPAAYRLG